MNLTLPHNLYIELGIVVALAVIMKAITPNKRTRRRKSAPKSSVRTKNKTTTSQSNNRMASGRRPDDVILRSPISELTWAEFERLLALYFRDNGYDVQEPGVGGKDGGVDLIITHRRTRERTAVQAKHWDDRHPVGPDVIRALDSAKKNPTPGCHFAMLVTSSDVTAQARKEAEARHIEFWHGALLEHRLEKWDKWQGKTKRRKSRMS